MKIITHETYNLEVLEDGTIFRQDRIVLNKNGTSSAWKRKELKQYDNGHGYKAIHFWINEKNKAQYVHRIVALAYIENPFNLPEVNHIDGNRSNNHFSNLEWVDRKQNVKDYIDKGRARYSSKKVIQLDEKNLELNKFNSLREAAIHVGCSPENIGTVINGRGKTAAGFKWKFEEKSTTTGKLLT